MSSRITVDADLCMASGYCFRDLPDIFKEEPDGSSSVRDTVTRPTPDVEGAVRQAAWNCPASAIELGQDATT